MTAINSNTQYMLDFTAKIASAIPTPAAALEVVAKLPNMSIAEFLDTCRSHGIDLHIHRVEAK